MKKIKVTSVYIMLLDVGFHFLLVYIEKYLLVCNHEKITCVVSSLKWICMFANGFLEKLNF